MNAGRNWENTIYLIDILKLGVRAIKFLEKLITLLLIPLPGSLVVCEKQDKVNSADSAFKFLIIQSQNQWSGWSGQRRWSCLVWSLLER